MGDDPRQIRHGLDVVDDRGLSVQSNRGREERGLNAGKTTLAFEGLNERGLFAADVRTRARVNNDVQTESRTENVRAEGALLVRVVECLLHSFKSEGEFSTQIDERLIHLQCVRCDGDALHQLVGVALNEVVVLEGGGFGFVTVHDEVTRRCLAQH